MKVDLHVATEGAEDSVLETCLHEIGLHSDELVDRHVTFVDDIAMSSCPLIGLHMTKKYDEFTPDEAIATARHDIAIVKNLLEEHKQVGYAHMEMTLPEFDVTLKSTRLAQYKPWPVKRFEPTFRADNKKWDIHIAIPVDMLDDQLSKVFYQSGMYYIELKKVRSGVEKTFRIYTIQSVSPAADGRQLFNVLKQWFEDCRVPHVEMKYEIYMDMFRTGAPHIVPPTVDRVEYSTISAHLPMPQVALPV